MILILSNRLSCKAWITVSPRPTVSAAKVHLVDLACPLRGWD